MKFLRLVSWYSLCLFLCVLFILNSCKKEEAPKGVISGRVTLVGTQVPIEGIVISFSGPRTGSVATGTDGTFSFTELPIGEYTIRVSVSSSYLEVNVPNQTVRGDQTTSVDISLTPKGSISGTILEEGSTNAIEGASVSLSGGPLNLTPSLTTVTDGKYSFSAIPDGSYIVSVSHPDYVNAEKEITVLDGGNVQADIPLMKESGSINGKLTINGSQIPVSGVVIDLRGPKNDSQISDENGSFSFSDLPVGEYSLSIEVPSSYNDVSDISVAVISGETTEVPILLTPKGGISGKVSGEDKPGGLTSAQLTLSGGPTNVSKSATTNTSGEYTFTELADGNYQLEASHPDYASDVKIITLTDGSIEMVDFVLSKSKGSLSGKVTVIGTQIPISGIGISISGTMESSTTTNDEGRYTFANIPVGTYELEVVVSSDYKPVASISVSIKKDETTTRDITLTPKGGIAGKITQEGTTNGIAGANVRLSGGPTNDSESKTTGISGQYSFDNLLSGTYTISVTHPNFGDESEEFKVSEGEISNGDIALGPLGASMQVNPIFLDFGVENSQLSLNIRNSGRELLRWFTKQENDELTLLPLSGELEAFESQSVSVSLDRDGLPDGEYEYKFSILSNGGNQDVTVEFIVDSGPKDPCEAVGLLANFEIENNGCKAPCTVRFNNTSENATNYKWIFEDGYETTDPFPSREYTKPGPYNVTLLAFNGECQVSKNNILNIRWEIFERTFGGGQSAQGGAGLQMEDGGFVFVGGRQEGVNLKLYMGRIEKDGTLVWDKNIEGSRGSGLSIEKENEGGFLITNGNSIARTNVSGGPTPGGLIFNALSCTASQAIQTDDGDYIVIGSGNFEETGYDICLTKVEYSFEDIGYTEWERSLGGKGVDSGTALDVTQDGGFVITGFIEVPNVGRRLAIIKTLSNGDIVWENYFGNTISLGNSIKQTRDGGFIAVGQKGAPSDGELYLVKTFPNGELEWEKTHRFPNSRGNRGTSVVQSSDGGYVVTGYFHPNNTQFPDLLLIKFNPDGSKAWEQVFGGTFDELGRSVVETADGGYMIVGTKGVQSTHDTWVYILKTDNRGNVE